MAVNALATMLSAQYKVFSVQAKIESQADKYYTLVSSAQTHCAHAKQQNSPLCTRLIHYHHTMITAFERMRTIRDYRTPRTIRSFCKMVVFILPSLLSPWFAFIATKGAMDVQAFQNRTLGATAFDQNWSAYYAAFICGTYTHIHTYRHTDKQADRHADRQTHTYTCVLTIFLLIIIDT